MDVPRFHDLSQERICGPFGNEFPIESEGLDPGDVGEFEGVGVFHGWDAGVSDIMVDGGDACPVGGFEVMGEAFGVVGFVDVVYFFIKEASRFFVDGYPVLVFRNRGRGEDIV